MKINLFKKKKKEETIDVADKEKQQSEFQFMLDTETERAETLENLSLDTVEMGKTIIIPTEEKDKEDISSDENLDDEDEYEYVTVHYGRNAFVLAVIFVFVGIIVSYLVLAPSMKQTIRELYQNNGYNGSWYYKFDHGNKTYNPCSTGGRCDGKCNSDFDPNWNGSTLCTGCYNASMMGLAY